jgi:hypothetical protein
MGCIDGLEGWKIGLAEAGAAPNAVSAKAATTIVILSEFICSYLSL